MHIAAGGSVLALGAIIMGAILGYIFYKYDSLWICIISHIAANLPDFILFKHSDMANNLLLVLKVLFVAIFISSFIIFG